MDSDTSPESRSSNVLETLPLSVATVDEEGVIVDTNREWRAFGAANGIAGSPATIGVDYLEVTGRAAENGDEDAERAASGLRDVLAGRRESFSMEYPCHSPSERRWFLLWTGGFVDHGTASRRSHTSISPTGSSRSDRSNASATRSRPSANG